MPKPGPSLQAKLVADNSLLATLCDYFCDHLSTKFSGPQLLGEIQQGLTNLIGILRGFAEGGCIHSTDLAVAEFKPYKGRLGSKPKITASACTSLELHVRGLLVCAIAEENDCGKLRCLPHAPRRLVGSDGLTNADFSLVALALKLATNGDQVYILTNDVDLLNFVTWVRTSPEARNLWGDPSQVQGLLSLHYLELIHRNCTIATELMADLLGHVMIEHYLRTELAGTAKGTWIMQRLVGLQDAMRESALEKLQRAVRS